MATLVTAADTFVRLKSEEVINDWLTDVEFAKPLDVEFSVDSTADVRFEVEGLLDDGLKEFTKIDVDDAFIDGAIIEEYVEVLLKASTEVDGSIIELLFVNPADDDILVDCVSELVFDACGK